MKSDPREITRPEVDFSNLFEKSSPYKYTIIDDFDWNINIIFSPLNKRSWVCQEQIMVGSLFEEIIPPTNH